MRRKLIQTVLPLLFVAIPVLGAIAVAAAIEGPARNFYLNNLTWMDVLILSLGSVLFVLQMLLAWKAMRWRGSSFDERSDPMLNSLAQAAEWFPLLGLLGTVAGILQTFSNMSESVTPREIIQRYAPAITATGSGLLMALINILPTWMVPVGRNLIRSLSGIEEPQEATATVSVTVPRPNPPSSHPGTRSDSTRVARPEKKGT